MDIVTLGEVLIDMFPAQDIVEAVKEQLDKRNIKIEYEDVKDIFELFLDEIIGLLKQEKSIEFRNFGVFKTYIRKGRKGHNPKTKIKNTKNIYHFYKRT